MKIKLRNKRIGLGLLLILLCANIYAENVKIKALIGEEKFQKLLEEGVICITKEDRSKELDLLPQNKYSNKIKESLIEKNQKNFSFTYESLFLINKEWLLNNGTSSNTNITIEDVSKIIRSVSKMKGMKYYSSTKKKECILYEEIYMVDEENSNKSIPDQNIGNADGQISYCMQNDSSFGVNHYKLIYFQSEDSLMAQFNITDTMGLGPFKAIYPGKMVINILVIDCGEDFLLYLNTDLDSVKYPGIKAQITDSMTSRMNAVYNWFTKQF